MAAISRSDGASVESKVGATLLVAFAGTVFSEELQALIAKVQIAGVLLYAWNIESPNQVRSLINSIQEYALEHLKRPLIIAVDQEGGRVTRLKSGFTIFSSFRSVARVGDLSVTHDWMKRIGLEMKAAGFTLNLAPVADVNSNPKNPVIGLRSAATVPGEVILQVDSALSGLHAAGVGTCLKHFPGHGDTDVDSHHGLPVITKTREETETKDIAPFLSLADRTDAVMSAHIMVPALDPKHCATTSPDILGRLRAAGFDGPIISDSVTMKGLLDQYEGNTALASIAAFAAGCDLLCIGGKVTAKEVIEIHAQLVSAVTAGTIAAERLEEAIARNARLFPKSLDLSKRDITAEVGTKSNAAFVDMIAKRSFEAMRFAPEHTLSGRAIVAFTPKALLEEVTASGFFDKLSIIGSVSEEDDLSLTTLKGKGDFSLQVWFLYNLWANPLIQKALINIALDPASPPIVLIAAGDPIDNVPFLALPKVVTICNIYSPTRGAMEYALSVIA